VKTILPIPGTASFTSLNSGGTLNRLHRLNQDGKNAHGHVKMNCFAAAADERPL
jgi:hypothetical protein